VDIVKEVARDCPLPINRETTLEAQAWILHTQIAREITAGAQFEDVICDRSVLDNYVYLVHRVGHRTAYDELVRSWMATYSALFKVPILQEPSFDGTRDVSGAFQGEIDLLLDQLLDRFAVPCLRLDPADRDGWVDAVLRRVGLPLHPPQIDLFSEGGSRANRL